MSHADQRPTRYEQDAETGSDAELEAVLPPVDQNDAGPSFASPFKAPPNPAVPQDISFIMEMVSANQVVGALPPLSMTAAEKRKLVEESMRSRKGKEKEVPPQAITQESAKEDEGEIDSDSDSSSEFESSEEEEGQFQVNDEPLTNETHQQLRQELDHFVNPPPQKMETASDSDSESESGSEEGILSGFAGKGFEFMDDSDGEADGGGGPITSTHEVSLIPVQQPPFEKLPEGEKVSLAGDVVSFMREKKVEVWLEKEKKRQEEVLVKQSTAEDNATTETAVNENETAVQPVEPAQNRRPSISLSSAKPNFVISGTVVVRAMQSRPGAADEGWLEEGSVLCWEDGRVLGTVHETFGPLTSPFYTIRLPPPPFPYPSLTSLTAGTRLFYPLNSSYRSFVNMLAVRDPRFKGSDASNLYDEEIGEDEMEWSDDEAEAEAKKRRKSRKSRTPSVMGTPRSRGGGFAGLPPRPHSDFHPDDISDTASLYGAEPDDWESRSDAGSTASSRARAMPAPYEVEVDETGGQADMSGARGGRGQGRGQGRERGRGRGGRDRGRGNGPQRGRGGRAHNLPSNHHHQSAEHDLHNNQQSRQSPYLQQSWSPQQQQLQQQHQQQQHDWSSQQSQHFGAFPFAQPGFQMPMPIQMPFFPQQIQPQGFSPQMNIPYEYAQSQYQQPYEQFQQGYDPTNPSAPAGYVPQQSQQHQPNEQDGHTPAINPRFAAQYHQMMQEQGQGQGQSHAQSQAQWNENHGGI